MDAETTAERDPRMQGRVDLVTVGEAMNSFVAHGDSDVYRAIPAGAEANVAVGMARLGLRTRWVSRLGDDPLGDRILRFLESEGVDAAVERDPVRPTGVLTKHVADGRTTTGHHRTGSAASALSLKDLQRIGPGAWLHLTGITPALSTSASHLVLALLDAAPGVGRTSFDVNLRPVLWPDLATAAAVLTRLASQADVVFIGDDEADVLLGTSDPEAVARALGLRGDREIVLKHGAAGASVIAMDWQHRVAGLPTDVVDLTGAGDAFAAGYLAGHCFGWSAIDRLRLGNFMGSRVVGTLEDAAPAWTAEERHRLSPAWLASAWDSL